MSSEELDKYVRTALDSNPFLEETMSDIWPDRHSGGELSFESSPMTTGADSDGRMEACQATSLKSHLLDQLWTLPLDIREMEAAQSIIDHLDDAGRLDTSLEDIAHDGGLESDILEKGLKAVQSLNPAGVGARDLRECLLIQLERLGRGEGPESIDARLAARCVGAHLDLVLGKKFTHLAQQVGASESAVRESLRLLSRLDLRPGLLMGPKPLLWGRPDLIVRSKGTRYEVVLSGDPVGIRTIHLDWSSAREQLREARDLVRALQERKRTLLKIGRHIVREQHEFFESGEESLRPLMMLDVARQTGFHVSTVSRAIRFKTMDTPQGVLPMKMFFQKKCGRGNVSHASALRKLRSVILSEDKARPLSDHELSLRLAKESIPMARRTVAKYRTLLNIPAKHLRQDNY